MQEDQKWQLKPEEQGESPKHIGPELDNVRREFKKRIKLLESLDFREADARLKSFVGWLESVPEIKVILDQLEIGKAKALLIEAGQTRFPHPPNATTPDEVAAIGYQLLIQCKGGENPTHWATQYRILPPYSTRDVQVHLNTVISRYIQPFIEYISDLLESQNVDNSARVNVIPVNVALLPPPEIIESLRKFKRDHPEPKRAAFIMMRFGSTQGHLDIADGIRQALSTLKITALRADEKSYHDDLFSNVLTYIYGCQFGIAVFERLESNDFNPNVSLEVGYMKALKKDVCLLKDQTLQALQTDLVGKLYHSFNPQDPKRTIPLVLNRWVRDKELNMD